MHTILVTISFCVLLTSCYTSSENNSEVELSSNKKETAATAIPKDSTHQAIYEFMTWVKKDQGLDSEFGLDLVPSSTCAMSGDERTFLNGLLIGREKEKMKEGVVAPGMGLPECLRPEDVDWMLVQRKKFVDFTWNPTKLGFKWSNKDNWYQMSVPVFSKDGNKAVLSILNLCPGLCGWGSTIVCTRSSDGWISQTISQWIY